MPPLVASPISTGSPSSDLFADSVAFHDRQEQPHYFPDEDQDSEFQPSQNFQFAASDFDFLLTKGGGNDQSVETPRDSLLLRFDPLLKVAPVVNSGRLSVTLEEEPEEEQRIDDPELVAIEGSGMVGERRYSEFREIYCFSKYKTVLLGKNSKVLNLY